MRSRQLLFAGAAALVLAACAPAVQVRTALAPDASLGGLHTFTVLNAPARREGAPALSPNDPMLDNSMTNRALRDDLVRGFEARGYTATPRGSADFVVAYYAGTKEKFDTTYWGPAWDPAWRYTYWGHPRLAWPWAFEPAPWVADVTSYTQGQVIVDVIDPNTRQLMWRGQGVAEVSDDPSKYAGELQKAVSAILKKFPPAGPAAAVGAR